MTLIFNDKTRRVIPRWRDSRTTALLGELSSVQPFTAPVALQGHEFDRLLDNWHRFRTLETAAELIATGVVIDRAPETAEAAKYLLDKRSSPQGARHIAELVLRGGEHAVPNKYESVSVTGEHQHSRSRIAFLRSILIDYPRDPLLWTDLAREYVLIGQLPPSIRAIERALALAPDNRFVLRSASRLFVHSLDPERAHDILRRSRATRHDPWLLAAEVAIAEVAGRTPVFAKAGRQLLNSEAHAPGQVSELASAIGTLELQDGSERLAKRLLRQSLNHPTENAVAQAAWVARRVKGLEITSVALDTPRSFEARAWQGFSDKQWDNAVRECENWLGDEPFSNRPAELGSFVAAVALQDFDLCERFARKGLLANPGHVTLTNNLVVALANKGKLDKAWELFRGIPRPAATLVSETTLLATEGLLLFRSGNHDNGRAKYTEAIAGAAGKENTRLRSLAAVHLAREEIIAHTSRAVEAFVQAEHEATGEKQPDVEWLLQALRILLPQNRS